MRLEVPAWWYQPGGFTPTLLQPLGSAWGAIARRRFERTTPHRSALPVICAGNFTAGGTGKTPLALLIAAELQQLGRRPAFLSRGYGGRLAGPHWVDPDRDTAADVGDEPLLLARTAPALVARDRAEGARMIERASGAPDVIVMDDGLQNPALAKSLVLAVVDGARGLGNGRVIPAGPLRAPLEFQLRLADAIIVNVPPGGTEGSVADWLRQRFLGPVLMASVEPSEPVSWLAGASVVAYAGTGAPHRFFGLLTKLGANLVHSAAFGDHHPFSEADAERLIGLAAATSALLVTTEKDWARLEHSTGACAALKAASRPLHVKMVLNERDRERLLSLLAMALKAGTAAPAG